MSFDISNLFINSQINNIIDLDNVIKIVDLEIEKLIKPINYSISIETIYFYYKIKNDKKNEMFYKTTFDKVRHVHKINLLFNKILKYILIQDSLGNSSFNEFITHKSNEPIEDDIIIESSDTNFGHNSIVWEGLNINFPEVETPETNLCVLTPENIRVPNDIETTQIPFDKQAEIERAFYEKSLHNETTKYFKLFRYGYRNLNKPLDCNSIKLSADPTLSVSLFIPNNINISDTDDFKQWAIKYYVNLFKQPIAFNHYFPNGNIRYYLDWYMLEKFKNIPDTYESPLNLNAHKFNSIDYENKTDVNNILEQFINFIYQNFETDAVLFNNTLERFLYYLTLVTKCYNNNGNLEFKEKSADFFVYKMSGPFIENKDTPQEGHITNGYIGQHMRFISIRQTDYDYIGETIKKPTHLIWRDNHSNCIAYNDHLWIKSVNEISSEFYFLPTSFNYVRDWHDMVKCDLEDYYVYRSTIAGIIQITHSSISINDLLYLKTIGMAFIVNNMKSYPILPLLQHRPTKQYNYGIDEYILSSLLTNTEIKKNTLYFNHHFSYDLFLGYDHFTTEYKSTIVGKYISIINKAIIFLIFFLIQQNLLSENEEIGNLTNFIKKLEILRETDNLLYLNNYALGFLLSIVPNKYHVIACIFDLPQDRFMQPRTYKNYLTSFFANDISFMWNYVSITSEKLLLAGINCKSNIIFTSHNHWCFNPYLRDIPFTLQDYNPQDYFSGFYKAPQPSFGINIIRQPSDLHFAFDTLQKNNLIFPLNKSNYKLKIEKPDFINNIKTGNVIMSTGEIKPILQYIILTYDTLTNYRDKIITIEPSAIIWKALNFSGYDVPPLWFNTYSSDDDICFIFNEFVTKLSTLTGWSEYAVKILTNDKDSYDMFDSNTIKTKSEYYKKLSPKDFSNYKMASYL